MSKQAARQWIYLLGGLLLAACLVWFGAVFLSISATTFTHTQLLLFGLFVVIGGICLLTLPDIKRSWPAGLLLTAVGFYGCARAADVIREPWLARLVGVACWLAALGVIYLAWPGRHIRQTAPPYKADKDARN